MLPIITPCSNQFIQVLLGTQCIQCIMFEDTQKNSSQNNFRVKAYQKRVLPTPIIFLQPTLIEQTIRSFLTQHHIPNAFVTLALTHDAATNQQTISMHQLLQCQLIAINTPFHLAGVTTHQLAQQYAMEQQAITPKPGPHPVAAHDLLCSIGMYIMARRST